VTTVRIAHAEPRPGRMPDGSVVVGQFLIVLVDTEPAGDGARRALPLWLRVPGGGSLWQLLDRPAEDAAMADVLEETAARLLRAAGVRVSAVDIEPISSDASELRSDTVTARVGLGTAGGTRHVTVSAGYGLALAVASGAQVRVADAVMDRLGVPVKGDDLLTPFLPRAAACPPSPQAQRWRFEPRNLAFTDGLDRWELAGSFRDAGQQHWQDYSRTAADRSAALASSVPEPSGFAVLFQTIFADDYRGGTVTFRGELRTRDLADQAGLHLTAGRSHEPPAAQLRNRGGRSLTAPGSSDWTWHEVTVPVPGDAMVIRFGISLTGRGRIELRNAELTSGSTSTRPQSAE
jgi:hypothetical protein